MAPGAPTTVAPKPNYHGNSINSVVFTMKNYQGGTEAEKAQARKGRAKHSVTFATLDEPTFNTLPPEQKATWVKYDPRWDNPKSTDTPYYIRSVAYTADPNAKGKEAIHAILSGIAGIGPSERIRAQKFNPVTGEFENYYYRNTHELLDGVYTPLRTRQFGNMKAGQFYNSAMDWLAEGCKEVDKNSTCHKRTSALYARMPHLLPGVFSFGGWKGGTTVSENAPWWVDLTRPMSSPNLLLIPDYHAHRILQWDDGEAFDPNSLQIQKR